MILLSPENAAAEFRPQQPNLRRNRRPQAAMTTQGRQSRLPFAKQTHDAPAHTERWQTVRRSTRSCCSGTDGPLTLVAGIVEVFGNSLMTGLAQQLANPHTEIHSCSSRRDTVTPTPGRRDFPDSQPTIFCQRSADGHPCQPVTWQHSAVCENVRSDCGRVPLPSSTRPFAALDPAPPATPSQSA